MTLNQNRNKFFQCTASGICAKWNDLLDQLIAAVDGASYGGENFSEFSMIFFIFYNYST